MNSQENYLLEKMNQERTNRGKQPLTASSELTRMARLKAQDMVRNKYFSHTSPTYGTAGEMLRASGIKYSPVGENLAKASSVSSAFTLFMDSSVHRANILSSTYNKVGIGIVPRSGGIMVAVIFTK